MKRYCCHSLSLGWLHMWDNMDKSSFTTGPGIIIRDIHFVMEAVLLSIINCAIIILPTQASLCLLSSHKHMPHFNGYHVILKHTSFCLPISDDFIFVNLLCVQLSIDWVDTWIIDKKSFFFFCTLVKCEGSMDNRKGEGLPRNTMKLTGESKAVVRE